MGIRGFDARWLLAVGATVIGLSGCASVETREAKGKRTSTLGTPKATVVAAASPNTVKTLGIVEWRLFRSKKDLHLTGYDAKGNAVKGLTTGFGEAQDGSETFVRTRLNDGSHFKSYHGMRSNKNVANESEMTSDSTALVERAFIDLTKANLAFRKTVATTTVTTKAAAATCGADLSAVVAEALKCMQGAQSKAAKAACAAAAKAATESQKACENTGTTTAPLPPPPAPTPTSSSSGGAATSSSSGSGGGANEIDKLIDQVTAQDLKNELQALQLEAQQMKQLETQQQTGTGTGTETTPGTGTGTGTETTPGTGTGTGTETTPGTGSETTPGTGTETPDPGTDPLENATLENVEANPDNGETSFDDGSGAGADDAGGFDDAGAYDGADDSGAFDAGGDVGGDAGGDFGGE